MKNFNSLNFQDKKVLVRVDFNVPLEKETYRITDDTRITSALPTIKKILKDGGSVILMSHLGRPKLGFEERFSLKHLVPHLSDLLDTEVKFCNDSIGKDAETLASYLRKLTFLQTRTSRKFKLC